VTRRGRAADDHKRRLLEAWRGEVQAQQVYELLAARESDARRSQILRKLAAAEVTHRQRLERRMSELGVAVPDPSSVGLSWWQRLQARLAPVERVLAAREAAESDEVTTTYGGSTGDERTDAMLSEIAADEREHADTIRAMLGADGGEQSAVGNAGRRLERILSRERGHRAGGGWVSGAIYGANDGLAAVFGIVAGVSGATNGGKFVLTAGLAGAIASALSMATGAFLAERSEAEVAEANLEQERREILENPEEEREELALILQLKGVEEEAATELSQRLAEHPEAMLAVLASEELGGGGEASNPLQAALAGGLSTALGAIVPVVPFIFTTGTVAIVAAAAVSLVAHFLVGAAKSLFTLRSWWAAGLEMTMAGVLVGGVLYGVGVILPVPTG